MAVKCPDCNSFNQTHASNCRKCGADLNPKTTSTESNTPDKSSVPWYKRLLSRRKQ
jgi:ribosomal protein L40E